ncbi:MFS transporter [Psychrobacter arenosus]|uniref:MFS transporter n=1 Tax=Psychrobacter arenosus TaxID=256326 RepID=UPI0019189994|nr:MFS transporter [Psychrobacter arenosus]
MPFNTNPRTLRQLGIISFSNFAAFFDFLIYLYLADILSAAFFPATEATFIGKLQTLSLFSAGYLSRPIGALLLGRFGDIKGRKATFYISASFIALTSLATACLPTYAQAGILAPILFFTARVAQGMAFGAHSTLGWVYLSEQAPKSQMAFYSSVSSASFMVGIVATLIIFKVIFNTYTDQALVEYAWRIPFVISACLATIAVLLGRYLTETPLFLSQKVKRSYIPRYKNFSLSFKRFNAIFITVLLSFYISSLVIVVALLLPQMITHKFSIDPSLLGFSNGLAILFLSLGCVFFGLMADKGHIGKALMIGSIAVALQSLAFYYHLQNSSGDYILLMYTVLGFSTGVISLCPVIMVQLFPTRTRLTAVALSYNCTYAVVGGALPIGLMYATDYISFSPALYLTFIGIVGVIIGMYVMRAPPLTSLSSQV